MNLCEAARTSRPFRRVGWKHYLSYDTNGNLVWDHGELAHHDVYASWLLADDWEIEESSVTITRSQLYTAIVTVLGGFDYLDAAYSYDDAVNFVAKKLGL